MRKLVTALCALVFLSSCDDELKLVSRDFSVTLKSIDDVFELRSHRACQNDGVYRQLELGKRLGQLGFVGLAQRQQEFLVLMFDYQFDE